MIERGKIKIRALCKTKAQRVAAPYWILALNLYASGLPGPTFL
jgi:hypothetical protein